LSDFPESLEIAISSLINTLVYKIITAESDADAVQEFIHLTGIPSANDVSIANYARQKADEIWGPYLELPRPSSLDGAIESLASARERLTNTGVTQLEDAESFSLSALVPGYMEDFRTNQAGWRGATIDAVRSHYLDRWGGMVFLQANTIALLELVLRGYQEQIKQAQNDVVDLVNGAEQVIAAYDPSSLCGSTESKNLTFNIAIGVAVVLSAGAGAVAMGVTSIVAAAVAAGLGVAKDEYQPVAPEGAEMGGDSVAEIWQSILDATERLRQQFSASEKELHDIIRGFHDEVVNGRITVGKSGDGEVQSLPTMELLRSKPLGATSSLERPIIGSDNPDPAHSPHR
jgi:hypothetical protein